MTVWRQLARGFRTLTDRSAVEAELDDEIRDYYERARADFIRQGLTPEEAARVARRELGDLARARETLRSYGWENDVDATLGDIRQSFRRLRQNPTFAAVVVLTLALGVGVNVAIFSLAEQILLRPLAVPEPDRLVNLVDPAPKQSWRMDPVRLALSRSSDGGGPSTVFSYPMFRDLEREQEPFVGLAAHTFFDASLSTGERARLATGAFVSGSYFPVLGLRPALGRLLGPEDDRVEGQASSVVLSHEYWQSEFGGDPEVLGRTLVVNDAPLTIVGVAPRGFHGTAVGARASVFVPISITFPSNLPPFLAASSIPNHDRRDYYWLHLFARLEPGVSHEAAAAQMSTLYGAILSEVEAPLLTNADEPAREAFRTRPLTLEPGARGQTSDEIALPARKSLLLLLAVSGVVLLLCCANVAGLMLIRATARGGEMAVRTSMGATRRRVASLLAAESLVLALPAALLSLPVALLTLGGASRVPGIAAAAPDGGLSALGALVGIGVAVASALAAGLLPVGSLIRMDPRKALQTHGARHTAGTGLVRFRAVLATAQVALSMALLAMLGVFAQSLANIARLDLGVDLDSVVMFSIPPPPSGLTISGPGSLAASARLTEALYAIPGVSSVASSQSPLLSPEQWRNNATLEGTDGDAVSVSSNFVSPDFFRTFGIELLAGREFNETDVQMESVPPTIVNQKFAERFGLDPEAIIGRSVTLLGPQEIVGVVADVRFGKVTGEIEPQVFVPNQAGYTGFTFYVRSARPPEELLSAVRETVARVDPTSPITNLRTMEQQFRENIAIERFFAGTSTAFAVLATALAALGLYGVLAYSVAQRSREIALRFALGAPADRIRAMVLRQVAAIAVIGIVVGSIAASILGRAARNVLFGVEPGDPLALAAAAAVLAAVMLAAACIPAWRASRVDPMVVLRYE